MKREREADSSLENHQQKIRRIYKSLSLSLSRSFSFSLFHTVKQPLSYIILPQNLLSQKPVIPQKNPSPEIQYVPTILSKLKSQSGILIGLPQAKDYRICQNVPTNTTISMVPRRNRLLALKTKVHPSRGRSDKSIFLGRC